MHSAVHAKPYCNRPQPRSDMAASNRARPWSVDCRPRPWSVDCRPQISLITRHMFMSSPNEGPGNGPPSPCTSIPGHQPDYLWIFVVLVLDTNISILKIRAVRAPISSQDTTLLQYPFSQNFHVCQSVSAGMMT